MRGTHHPLHVTHSHVSSSRGAAAVVGRRCHTAGVSYEHVFAPRIHRALFSIPSRNDVSHKMSPLTIHSPSAARSTTAGDESKAGDPVTSIKDPFAHAAHGYLDHCDSARGAVRHELVARQLATHVPPAPARIVDVGGGGGHQALRLALLGHHVTVVDPSMAMLEQAREALAGAPGHVGEKVTLVEGDVHSAIKTFGEAVFDIVLCHGVLMYLDRSDETIDALVRLCRVGGLLSIVTKNAASEAMRPALEGRYRDAVATMTEGGDRGRLGIATRGDTLQELADLLRVSGAQVVEWFGVRVFSDHLDDSRPGTDFGDLLEAEWMAARRDPYRQVGRLLHVIARRV